MTDQKLVERAEAILKPLTSPRHWLSTSRLAHRLGVTPERLEEVLTGHAQGQDWTVRYSYYPSRRSLEMLWGHRLNVGKQAHLPDRERTDAPEEGEVGPDSYESWIFLSHNRKDAQRVREVAEVARSCDLGPWTFQEQIGEGKPIIPSVRQAIEDCRYFLLYLSTHSLPSVWVEKESHFWLAGHDAGGSAIVVVDARPAGLFESIGSALAGGKEPLWTLLGDLEVERRKRVDRFLAWLHENQDRVRLVRDSDSDDSQLRAALQGLQAGGGRES